MKNKKYILVILVFLIIGIIFIIGCIQREYKENVYADRVEETIGPSGGSITCSNARLDVPAGAFSENTTIAVEVISASPLSGCSIVGSVYNIWPTETTFSLPATITLSYDEADLQADWNEENLAIWRKTDTLWQNLGGTVDMGANKVSVEVTSLSEYTILYVGVPEKGVVSLENGSVNPSYGDTSTIFTYSVIYKDLNGYAPTDRYVCINGSYQTMTKVSGDYTSGAIFQYETTLPAGSHDYYFYFGGDQGQAARLPVSGTYSGPTAEFARIGASYTLTSPLFDGLMGAHGEDWGNAVITKTLRYANSLTGESETHEMNVYAMYDENNLYIAVTVENDEFFIATEHERNNYLWIYFDGNNNGIIEENEDIQRFPWDLLRGDFHFSADGTRDQDTQSNGGGRWRFVSISGNLGDATYEFEIPLDSGDVQDLSITPDSTVGIKIEYQEMYYFEETGILDTVGGDSWPSKAGVLDGLTYGKLTLGATARFTSDVKSGIVPLTVKFTEQCQGDQATSWAWDFNNDGVIDKTEPNPSYTYTNPGIYTVSLMITGPGGPDTVTKENYIEVLGD